MRFGPYDGDVSVGVSVARVRGHSVGRSVGGAVRRADSAWMTVNN